MASPFPKQDRRKQLIIICAISVAVLVVCFIAYIIATNTKGIIDIRGIAGSKATITLNGLNVAESQSGTDIDISAYPGQYRLEITKPGYAPFIDDIDINRGANLSIRPAFAFQPTQVGVSADTTIRFVQPAALPADGILYLGNGGSTIFEMSLANQTPQAITQNPLSGVEDIRWSAQPNLALIMKSDGAYIQEMQSYDFLTQTQTKIAGNEFEYAAWDPNTANRLAVAYYPNTGEQSLIFSDPTGAIISRQADLSSIYRPKLVWSPDSRYIAVIGRATDTSQNQLWVYNVTNGSFNPLTQAGGVVDASFSPDGSTVLYETANGVLSTVSSAGGTPTTLSETGHVSQASWKSDNSFYLPDSNGDLTLYTVGGSASSLDYHFSDPSSVQGMYYFSDSTSLLFYTNDALYTINVGS